MSIFDLFKKNKDNDSELIKWQNIIQHKEYDELIMSKSELTSFTLNIYLPNTVRIINDCQNLVNNTYTCEVYFLRFNTLIEYLNELSIIENFISFDNPLPSTQLNKVLSHKEILDKQFINRYFDNILELTKKLKTEKGRKNKFNKKVEDLLAYEQYLSTSNLEYIKILSANSIY